MNLSTNQIRDNIQQIREAIDHAARKSGREPGDVRLIAVSKTRPWEMVSAAIAAGQSDFGENTIQDGLTKTVHTAGTSSIQWHFIGHLQSNKTKFLPGNFHWLHTLDSLKLARRLEQAFIESRSELQVLLQVNVANDPAKQGVPVREATSLLEQLVAEKLSAVRLRGLMTIGAANADETQTREWFCVLRELREQLTKQFDLVQFDQLSMGMSDDYVEAIEEGATMVRIGSAIFGERAYPD
jgi:pyridoxal phosphate enzyme (YggS family)